MLEIQCFAAKYAIVNQFLEYKRQSRRVRGPTFHDSISRGLIPEKIKGEGGRGTAFRERPYPQGRLSALSKFCRAIGGTDPAPNGHVLIRGKYVESVDDRHQPARTARLVTSFAKALDR